MRIKAEVVLISTIVFLAGCGSKNNSIATVNAQANYATASLDGTYSINLSGITSAAGINPTNSTGITGTSIELSSFIGSFSADGNGNISSGTLTEFGANANAVYGCSVTFTGKYEIEANASGAATITVASTGANGSSGANCTWSGPVQFMLQAGMYGESLHLAEADGKGLITGMATKQ
jgi:hypothetical protein